MRRRATSLAVALLLGSPAATAAAPLVLDERPGRELGAHLDYLVEEGTPLDGPAALAAARAGRYRPVGAPARGLGVGARVVWLHARLQGGPPGSWQVTWDQPLVDRLDAWVVGGGAPVHLRGGLTVPPAERTIRHAGPYHQLPLALPAGAEAELLLRVESSRPVVVEAHLWSASGLEVHALGLGLLAGLETGALLLVVILSLVMGLVRRDRWSARLAAVLAAYLAYELAITGLGARWLWPGSPRWAVAAPPFFAAATALLTAAYARAYSDAQVHHPRLDRAARLVTWTGVGCAAAALLLPPAGLGRLALYCGVAPAVAAFGVMVALGVADHRRGAATARWFLASCLVVAAFGLVRIASITGLLPGGFASLSGLGPALLTASLLLFVGVIVRVEAERREATAGLSRAVLDQTASLRQTVARLQLEVTERERAEQQLREADERFRMAFETSPDAINLNRLSDGVYLAINPGFTRMTGWTEADVLGRSSLELQIWADPADRGRLVEGLRAHGVVQNLEAAFRFKDGRVLQGLMSARVLQLGGVPAILSITRDITEMRRAELERDALAEQLRQAQKMEAIGRLAGGVAHDFNNLLTAITANASLRLLDLPVEEACRPYFEEIQDAAARATGLTRQLLAFSRRQVIAPRSLDLARHVTGLASMLRRVLGEDVAVSFAPGGDAPPVLADPGQVEQVVLNLAVNARDAVRPGGRIVISTAPVEVVEAGADRRPGRYGAIVVQDDGAGIEADVLPHIFEPFFTTKGGKGTGLGLSTVYGIASQHGGFVEVDSAAGRGTRVRVCFPASDAPPLDEPGAAAAEPLPGGHETVLLVEDEQAVRAVTRALLLRLGYQVLSAGDGAQALALAARQTGPLDLLLTDVVMPGLNGRQLAERLWAARPGLPVVYMSGYSQDVVDQAGVLEEGLILVQKPFQPARLAAALRQALATGVAAADSRSR
ncbi:MAG: response regulator [Anaeromyxobacter sp.]|nr:response regulator [Anaeromyxobacter sp.]